EIAPSHQRDWGSVPQSKRDDNIRRFRLVQLEARPVVVAPAGEIHDLTDWAVAPAASTGSTMLSPWRSRENVCSPNKSLSCGIRGWSSGMVRASNWPKVRSTCEELSFIAHSFRFAPRRCAAHHALRGLPPQVVKCEARSRAAYVSSSRARSSEQRKRRHADRDDDARARAVVE